MSVLVSMKMSFPVLVQTRFPRLAGQGRAGLWSQRLMVGAAEDQPWCQRWPELQHSSVFVAVSPPRNQSSTFLGSEVIIHGPVYFHIHTYVE